MRRSVVTPLLFWVVAAASGCGSIPSAGLPLEHAGVIREQAAAKGLKPELIAAVIYAETKFNPRTSAAGAEGLMQILPDTAKFIARRTGGTAFVPSDLATPSVNIRYGSWYLRYLLDRYGGNQTEAIAAYNAGMGNVDRWIASANSAGRAFSLADIRFPETRAYTEKVLEAEKQYRQRHGRELGSR